MASDVDVLADLLLRMQDGEFAAGERLPSEAALAEHYGVGRTRVRTALAGLARRGLVQSRANSGWVVQAPHQTQTLRELRSFAQWAVHHQRRHGGLIVARTRRPADATQARVLGVRLGHPLLGYVRVRTLDDRAVMVERSTWAPWVEHIVETMADDVTSTTATLDAAGVTVLVGDHRIRAVGASSEDARLLGIRRSTPMLEVGRSTFTPEGRIVEIGADRYLADAVTFVVGDARAVPE